MANGQWLKANKKYETELEALCNSKPRACGIG